MLAGALAGAYGFCQPTHQKSCLIPPTPVEAARLTARKSAASSSLLALQPQATATPTALGPGPAPECVQELMRQASEARLKQEGVKELKALLSDLHQEAVAAVAPLR